MKNVDVVWMTVLGTVLVLFMVWMVYLIGQKSLPEMARCSEDSVLVGAGEYNEGWWDSYECGPALDDFGG